MPGGSLCVARLTTALAQEAADRNVGVLPRLVCKMYVTKAKQGEVGCRALINSPRAHREL
jgi:hypothetical protein